MGWIDEVRSANAAFVGRAGGALGPVERMLITCMDPRIDLRAIGGTAGASEPGHHTLVVRTAGARVEERALLIGIFLAGVREVVVMTHTDCGCQRAAEVIDGIGRAMDDSLEPGDLAAFRDAVGPGGDDLRRWLRTFTDAREAAVEEVSHIRALPFVPADVIVHGAVYDVENHRVEVVVNADA